MGFIKAGQRSVPKMTRKRRLQIEEENGTSAKSRSRTSSLLPPAPKYLSAFERLPTELLQRIFLANSSPNFSLPFVSKILYSTLTTSTYIQRQLLAIVTSESGDDDDDRFRALVNSPTITDEFLTTLALDSSGEGSYTTVIFYERLYYHFPIRRLLFPPYNLPLITHLTTHMRAVHREYRVTTLPCSDQDILMIAIEKAVELSDVAVVKYMLDNFYYLPIATECWLKVIAKDKIDMMALLWRYMTRCVTVEDQNEIVRIELEDVVWLEAIERRGRCLAFLMERCEVPVRFLGKLNEVAE